MTPSPTKPTSSHTSPLWTLFWLKGKLTLRQFTRERGRILGAIAVLLIFGPIIVGATIGSAIGYRELFDHWPATLLGVVLVALWFVWLAFPILFSSINEGLDIQPLLFYPMSKKELAVSTLLGTFFDYPTYLVLPLFGAMAYGFGFRWSILVAMVVGYAHVIIIGQLVLTAVGGILQSRRFRDVSIIVFSLLGTSCYFLNQAMTSAMSRVALFFESEEQLLASQPLNILQWFPTGALAQFVWQVEQGQAALAGLWLLYSVLLLALLTFFWVVLLYRLATGHGFLLSLPQKEQSAAKKGAHTGENGRFSLTDYLPDDIAEIMRKEFRISWRLPQRRVGFLQGLIFPFFIFAGVLFESSDTVQMADVAKNAPYILPAYALFAFWAGTQNMLAWEGYGLATLLLTPIKRHRILIAKSMAIFVLVSAPYLLIGLGFVFLNPSWYSLAALLMGLWVGLGSMGVAAVGSILFPVRIKIEAKQKRSSFQMGGGCRAALGSVLLVPLMMLLLSLPTAVPLVLAYWLKMSWLAVLSIGTGFVYALFIFWQGHKLAGNAMLEREPELLEALKQPEE